jgi:hypothetical protein
MRCFRKYDSGASRAAHVTSLYGISKDVSNPSSVALAGNACLANSCAGIINGLDANLLKIALLARSLIP